MPAAELCEDRSQRRPIVPQLGPQRRRRLTGEQIVRGRRVIHVAVRHRPHDGQLVGSPREQRKMLTDLDPRHHARNRPELAANLSRRLRLQVPSILMRGPTPHEQQNARLGPPERTASRNRLSRRRIAAKQQPRHRHPEQTERPRAAHPAASDDRTSDNRNRQATSETRRASCQLAFKGGTMKAEGSITGQAKPLVPLIPHPSKAACPTMHYPGRVRDCKYGRFFARIDLLECDDEQSLEGHRIGHSGGCDRLESWRPQPGSREDSPEMEIPGEHSPSN